MFIIRADDVAQRRGFCNHFVTMRVCVKRGCVAWVGVCVHDKTKTPDRNDFTLGTQY